jgi:DNA-binding MarR family transcriptional regulator/GNAT superfamily N-acetyltransferase
MAGAVTSAADQRAQHVRDVRSFNRFYTAYVGALGDGHLGSPYGLTEARVLYEIANDPDATETLDLRRRLGLDPSYLSRILARFQRDGLVVKQRAEHDARRQLVTLTDDGRATFAQLDERAAADIGNHLDALGEEEQRELVEALGTVRRLLTKTPPEGYELRPLRPGDLGWVVQRNGAIYAQEYGWDLTYEALVARIVADYADNLQPEKENAWIAEVGGRPAGCVFCVRSKDAPDTTAQLRLLLVEPFARGMGIGSRLTDECLRFAREAGYERMVLWTNDVLASARRIYQRAGFELLESEPHHSFGHDLVGQYWGLNLA